MRDGAPANEAKNGDFGCFQRIFRRPSLAGLPAPTNSPAVPRSHGDPLASPFVRRSRTGQTHRLTPHLPHPSTPSRAAPQGQTRHTLAQLPHLPHVGASRLALTPTHTTVPRRGGHRRVLSASRAWSRVDGWVAWGAGGGVGLVRGIAPCIARDRRCVADGGTAGMTAGRRPTYLRMPPMSQHPTHLPNCLATSLHICHVSAVGRRWRP